MWRAQRLVQAAGLRRAIVAVGVVSALIVPLLVLDLGLVLQLLVSRDGPASGGDWVLGPWLGGRIAPWPFFGDPRRCLAALVFVSWGLAALEACSLFGLHRLVHRYALRAGVAMRRAIHDQAFVLGPQDLLGVPRSRPEELFAEKVETVRDGLVRQWLAIPRSLVELAVLILLALAVNVWLTLLALLLAGYVIRFHRALRRRAEARARTYREQSQERREELLRAIRLAPLAIGYSLERPPSGLFEEELKELEASEFRALTTDAARVPMLSFAVLFAVSFVLLLVGLSSEVDVAGTVLLGTALVCAYFPAARLYQLRDQLAAADAAAADVFAYLDRQPAVTQVDAARPLERLVRDIKLDRVTVADRQGRRLLDNVSVTIPAGQVAAILASDPETPLALAGLFVRFYDPAAGRILYDDHDICQATLGTVRGQAVLVAADGPIFPGTIADNVACRESGFTPLQINDALRQACAEEIVRRLPSGLATAVGGRHSPLPPDQAFRIGLARALLREPSLLVIQEPEAQADEVVSRELDAAVKQAAIGRTVVVLPARLATLRAADGIYLFHEGKLHAQGKHADLLQSSELYRHLNYVRFNVFRGKVRC